MAGGVLAEVADHAAQGVLITQDPPGRHPAAVDARAIGPFPQPPGLLEDQVVQIDGALRWPDRVLVGAGEEKEILHEALHADGLVQDRPGQHPRISARGMGEGHLGVLPDRGDG